MIKKALRGNLPYMMSYYLSLSVEECRDIVAMCCDVAQKTDLLCQFTYNGREISFRYYFTPEMLRVTIVEKNLSLYVDEKGYVTIEKLHLNEKSN